MPAHLCVYLLISGFQGSKKFQNYKYTLTNAATAMKEWAWRRGSDVICLLHSPAVPAAF